MDGLFAIDSIKVVYNFLKSAFTGMIKCWECGRSITAEEKNKYIKCTWEIRTYIYYRCSKRKKWCTCSQKCSQKTIPLNKLEEQINNILDNIEILPVFKEWWLKHLKKDFNDTIETKTNIINSLEKNIKSLEKKLNVLLDYLMDETISKEEYENRKSYTKKELKYDTSWLEFIIHHDFLCYIHNVCIFAASSFNFESLILECVFFT